MTSKNYLVFSTCYTTNLIRFVLVCKRVIHRSIIGLWISTSFCIVIQLCPFSKHRFFTQPFFYCKSFSESQSVALLLQSLYFSNSDRMMLRQSASKYWSRAIICSSVLVSSLSSFLYSSTLSMVVILSATPYLSHLTPSQRKANTNPPILYRLMYLHIERTIVALGGNRTTNLADRSGSLYPLSYEGASVLLVPSHYRLTPRLQGVPPLAPIT